MRFAEGVAVVGVDGDDTLWLCQDGFDAAEASLVGLVGPAFADELEVVSRRNLRLYGYGVKAWTLNCLEVALSLIHI